MPNKIPHSPFTTRLSGSAKETELRLRNIFQWKKKRPPVVLFLLTAVLILSCCGLVSCQVEEPSADHSIAAPTPDTAVENSTPALTDESVPSSTGPAATTPVVETPVVTTSADPTSVETPESEITPFPHTWYEGYKTILQDWTVIERLGDLSYLPFYFGGNYGFDHYFLYDVDANNTPELFLASSTMGLTAVLTYTDQPVFLLYDNLYGFNRETSEIIIRGHWHGAGGSGTKEWWGYHLSDGAAELSLYIDQMPSSYSVYNPLTEEWDFAGSQTEYEELYAAHVEQVIPVEQFRFYALDDLSGLEAPFTPSSTSYYPLRTADGRVLTLALEETEVADRENYYSVDEIRVYDGNTILQHIQTTDLTYEGDRLYEGLFIIKGKDAWYDPEFTDYNFDSSDDLKLLASDHFPKNVPFAFFLWNNETQQLDFSFVLSNSVVPYKSEQELREWFRDGNRLFYNYYCFDENGQLYLDRTEQMPE